MKNNMAGKTVFVTGGTDGIGLVTAREMADMGAQVVIAGRSPEKTAGVVDSIRHETGNSKVDFILADLSSQAQIRRMVEEFKQRYDRLDVLINNAGAIFMQRQVSVDGFEMTFALNHLNYFLVTNLLLDLLKASSPARIVCVSSAEHVGAKLDFSDLQTEKGYTSFGPYSRSKLANLYFTYELARRLAGTGVTANALHPGFVATNFGRSNGGLFNPIFRLFQVGAISPQEGARTSIFLASSPDLDAVTGKYFVKNAEAKSSPVSYDQQVALKLWDVSLEMTKLVESVRR